MRRNPKLPAARRRRREEFDFTDLPELVKGRPDDEFLDKASEESGPFAEYDDDDEIDEEIEAGEVVASDGPNSPDDALGLYLRQMGAIPLLNREQELTLARRLETFRQRYRHAALYNWNILGRVVETFERIKAGTLAIDPSIDVVSSLGLTRENILARIPHNLRTLRHVVEAAGADFRVLLRASTSSARTRWRHSLWRRMRKAAVLAEELSPRTE